MAEADMQQLLSFFRALADETRLRIVGLLAQQERSVEELATLLALRAPTISHHLAKLQGAGIIGMRREGTTHMYWLDGVALRSLSRDLLTPERSATWVASDNGAAWEDKVLHDFFAGERLKEIPASRKKRAVVLAWLADRFAADTAYPEAQVNAMLQRHHPDSATLRRELIGAGLLRREDNTYWRSNASVE